MSDFNLFYFMQLKVQRLVFLKEALSFFNPCITSYIQSSTLPSPCMLEMLLIWGGEG